MSVQATAVLAGELTKIRTVRSTAWTLLAAVAVSVGLSALIGANTAATYASLPPDRQRAFDPLSATFYSLTLGQLAIVVFGVLVVGGEYSAGTMLASLTAVPRRGLLYGAKVLACGLCALGASVVTVLCTFVVAQAALGRHGTSLGADGVPRAVVGACAYLTLICLFSMGVATMLRGSTLALAILLPLFFLGAQGLGNIPKIRMVTQYLPDQAGWVIMHLTGPAGDPQFGRPYGPWAGLGILALWTGAALAGGYAVLRRGDA